MKNFEYIEELIRTKTYEELSHEERKIISSEMGEDNYSELRTALLKIREERIPLKRNLKKELLKQRKEKTILKSFLLHPLPLRFPISHAYSFHQYEKI